MGRFYDNRGIPSLRDNDPVNILAAASTDNIGEYTVIIRF
jgi:hypothetical protein